MPALPFIGIILMLDSLFISNYFYIKILRNETDKSEEIDNNGSHMDDALPVSNDTVGRASSVKMKMINLSGDVGNAWLMVTDPDRLNEDQKTKARESRILWLMGCMKAIMLGVIHREPTEEKYFINWEPIPYRKGIISTALLLVLSVVVLAPEILKNFFSASDLNQMMTPDLCKVDDFAEQIALLNKTLEEDETNLPLARKQFYYYKEFATSLKKDTSLYGVESHTCLTRKDDTQDSKGVLQNISGNKIDWVKAPSEFPMIKYGTFFPGYCSAARELALENAKNAKCDKKVCKNHKFDPLKVFEVCVWVKFPCPRHTNEQEAEVDDYRQAQLRRNAELEESEEMEFETFQADEKLKSSVAGIIEKFMYQIDIASSLYVGYTALSLFFPTPLKVFRPHYGPMIKNFLFGANKILFMTIVIAIWWGAEYFANFYAQLRLHMNINLLTNPCFADKQFLEARSDLITSKCEELIHMSNEIRIANITIDHILQEVDIFNSECTCEFPFVNTKSLTFPAFTSEDTRKDLVLDRYVWGHISESLWAPNLGTPFFGNATICEDFSYTREKYLQPPEATANVWDVWVKTGLFAMMLVEITMANFGVSLLRVADPFSVCAGKYECPPQKYDLVGSSEDLEDLKKQKLSILAILGRRGAIGWGLLTNLSFINICASYWNGNGRSNNTEINKEHWAMFVTFLVIASLGPILVIIRRPLNLFLNSIWMKFRRETRPGKKTSKELMAEWDGTSIELPSTRDHTDSQPQSSPCTPSCPSYEGVGISRDRMKDW